MLKFVKKKHHEMYFSLNVDKLHVESKLQTLEETPSNGATGITY